MAAKQVYSFGGGGAEGSVKLKGLLGGKGAGLAQMARAKVPVPPGFTISTEACLEFSGEGKISASLRREIGRALKTLEAQSGKRLGQGKDPLLVSVRSGAAVSMPGMMDTILNLGLNDQSVDQLANRTGNARFALDSYRRFIQMFGNVVMGISHHSFESLLAMARKSARVKNDAELGVAALEALVTRYQRLVQKATGRSFPQDPVDQLFEAIEAVFGSWSNDRAVRYRQLNDIPHSLGTACTVQTMVFGNRGPRSGTGVGFTRNPSTGARTLYGEFLMNAQGEDVVAGLRTPRPLQALQALLPDVFDQLTRITTRLEKNYRDMQDFEFTIEEGKLFMLQTRVGKRTGPAALRIATEMVEERLITQKEALLRVEPTALLQLLHPVFDPDALSKAVVVAHGLNASPGAASGKIVFSAEEAVARAAQGEDVLLVRQETSPDDIHGMAAARGVLTAAGGMTSHAAVVGRQMGKPSVVGCDSLRVNEATRSLSIGEVVLKAGMSLSINGTNGAVMLGAIPTTRSELVKAVAGDKRALRSESYRSYAKLMAWADRARRLKVRANADSGADARLAVGFGAEGIGLCRTEHMFFAADRLPSMQAMILATTETERKRALRKLLSMQRKDFVAIFKAMAGRPVTIRTLDPPLHEFLPHADELKVEIALLEVKRSPSKSEKAKLAERRALLARVEELSELNPMLGWRGCRLGILVPGIVEMQARAIFEAALKVKASGIAVHPEVMIPLVGDVREFSDQKRHIDAIAKIVMKERGAKLRYTVGTMIEVPRGALTAGTIAEEAEFFSFGTNDLTQTTFGFSRDDSGSFLSAYVERGILDRDPFVSIDEEGVGQLMQMAVRAGRATRAGLKCGICGEHGGEPRSVAFFHRLGLNYVSCSPFRIPVARLAAAQAALRTPAASSDRRRSPSKKKSQA